MFADLDELLKNVHDEESIVEVIDALELISQVTGLLKAVAFNDQSSERNRRRLSLTRLFTITVQSNIARNFMSIFHYRTLSKTEVVLAY
jgi:hypothetical protein